MTKKVFVIDNKQQIADALSFVLREAELEVETFYDSHAALMRASDSPPDILVSDIDMPETGGVALAEAFRSRNPNCKVVLLSGKFHWKDGENWRIDEPNGLVLLSKPFSLSDFLNLIKPEQRRAV